VDGGRADDERSCPDTAAACLVRVASCPTRIDARIRVNAPKNFWTRVLVTQAITHKLSPNVRNPCGFHLEVLQDMRFPFGNFKSLIINKMPDFTKCLYVTYELVVDYGAIT